MASGHVNRTKGRTHGCTDQCCKTWKKHLPTWSRPHMAQNGHPGLAAECPFLAIKQTSSGRRPRSPFDPLRTLGRRCEVYGLPFLARRPRSKC
jgi:hypothetical protein